jgi:hypothetical protein
MDSSGGGKSGSGGAEFSEIMKRVPGYAYPAQEAIMAAKRDQGLKENIENVNNILESIQNQIQRNIIKEAARKGHSLNPVELRMEMNTKLDDTANLGRRLSKAINIIESVDKSPDGRLLNKTAQLIANMNGVWMDNCEATVFALERLGDVAKHTLDAEVTISVVDTLIELMDSTVDDRKAPTAMIAYLSSEMVKAYNDERKGGITTTARKMAAKKASETVMKCLDDVDSMIGKGIAMFEATDILSRKEQEEG